MKALVTGGGGFLGRYIVERLIDKGYTVTSLSRGDYPELREMGVRIVRADITDKRFVDEACAGVDMVFHTAAKVGVWGRYQDFYDINIEGTQNVIDACKRHGVKKLIYTSSPSVVFDGRDHAGVDESYPYSAKYMAFYPQTKAVAERNVLAANGVDGLMTCALRPHLVWGPRDTNLIPRLLERARTGKLAIVGDGKNMIDSVYVENAADAHILAGENLAPGSPVCGSAYFITQGQPVNCWGWINAILTRLGYPEVTKKIPYGLAWCIGACMEGVYKLRGDYSEPRMTRFLAMQLAMSHHFSIVRAKKDFGYNPTVSMDEGLERLAASMGR